MAIYRAVGGWEKHSQTNRQETKNISSTDVTLPREESIALLLDVDLEVLDTGRKRYHQQNVVA